MRLLFLVTNQRLYSQYSTTRQNSFEFINSHKPIYLHYVDILPTLGHFIEIVFPTGEAKHDTKRNQQPTFLGSFAPIIAQPPDIKNAACATILKQEGKTRKENATAIKPQRFSSEMLRNSQAVAARDQVVLEQDGTYTAVRGFPCH